MSRSWHSRMLIGLAPDRVSIIQLKPGKRLAPATHGVRSCVETAGAPWVAAVNRLEWMLEQVAPICGTADVVLSNQFVRFTDVPWTPGVYKDQDRQALAVESFRNIHGDVVDGWRVVLESQSFGRSSLAAAIDHALVDSLSDMLSRLNWRLSSLRPHLSAAFDRWQSYLDEEDGGFVVVEPGCVTGLFRRDGAWNVVDSRRYRRKSYDRAALTLRQCIDADHLQGGSGSVAVVAAGAELDVESTPERPLRRLTGHFGPWPDDPWRSLAWSAS